MAPLSASAVSELLVSHHQLSKEWAGVEALLHRMAPVWVEMRTPVRRAGNGARRSTYYGFRLASRALNGCRPTYQSTASNSNLLAITTRDSLGKVYLLVTNSAAKTSYTVDANLSALLTSGTGTMWQYDQSHPDVVVGSPVLSNGHVTFTIPGNAAILIRF